MNSEQTNEIAAALAKAQGAMPNAKYNKQMDMHGRKYQYADLAAIIDAIRQPLADNSISRSQSTQINPDGSFVLVTKLLHASGQWIGSEHPLPLLPDKPQILGSALTYARRYALAALCGISAEEDNDANGVAEATAEATRQAAKKPPKPKPDIVTAPPHKPMSAAEVFSLPNPLLHDPETGEMIDPSSVRGKQVEQDFANEPQYTPSVPGISIQDEARLAAEHGRLVLKEFYESKGKADRLAMKEIWPELEQLMDAAETYEGEGS